MGLSRRRQATKEGGGIGMSYASRPDVASPHLFGPLLQSIG